MNEWYIKQRQEWSHDGSLNLQSDSPIFGARPVQYVNAPLCYEKSRRMRSNDSDTKHVDQSNLPMVSIPAEYLTCVVHQTIHCIYRVCYMHRNAITPHITCAATFALAQRYVCTHVPLSFSDRWLDSPPYVANDDLTSSYIHVCTFKIQKLITKKSYPYQISR